MFKMTEALIHHARFCVLDITNADPKEIERELTTARAFAFDAGRAAFRNQVPMPSFLPEIICGAYEDGHMEACLDDSDEREAEEWRRTYAEEQEFYRLNYPDSPVERALYCPGGHNMVWTKAGYDECAACGQIMTENAAEEYMSSLVRAGQCM